MGGSTDGGVQDDEGPEISLYMNDTKFKDGGIVNRNATLLVYLSDDLGINVSGSSIGHDLKATLDNETSYILNEFYKAEKNDFTRGLATFPLNNLEIGLHTLTVKAWDIANNSVEATITFEVVESLDSKVINTSSYPNPFSENTTFVFEHDLLGEEVDIRIDIFDNLGRNVAYFRERKLLEGNRVELNTQEIETFNATLPSGVYYFKIKLQTNELNTVRESNFEKIVKIK